MKQVYLSVITLAIAVLGSSHAHAEGFTPSAIMATMEKVANYFMTSNPDVGANSYVGGKERNSRIWTRSVFYEGLLNAYREAPNEDWLRYAVDWGNYHQWISCADNAKRHADFQCCGQAYLQLYMLDPTQEQRMSHIKMRIDDMVASKKIDDWYWIDAIQMAMPIFALLGTITQDAIYWERMYDMYQYTRNQHGGNGKGGGKPLFNTSTGLWYRDYQFDPPYKDLTEPDKDCYWSRGNGWVYMALTRVLQFTPDNEAHRQDYLSDFRLMSKALLDCQREDGSWNVSLAAPSNYGAPGSEGPEMTGTSLFVGGMAYGVREGILDSTVYMPAIRRGWQAMHHAVHPDNGFVGYLQGAGSKPEDGGVITYDSKPDFEDFGHGCWLWGAAEAHALAALIEQRQTGINITKTDGTANGAIYNLAGQKVAAGYKGLAIKNGRMFVVK